MHMPTVCLGIVIALAALPAAAQDAPPGWWYGPGMIGHGGWAHGPHMDASLGAKLRPGKAVRSAPLRAAGRIPQGQLEHSTDELRDFRRLAGAVARHVKRGDPVLVQPRPELLRRLIGRGIGRDRKAWPPVSSTQPDRQHGAGRLRIAEGHRAIGQANVALGALRVGGRVGFHEAVFGSKVRPRPGLGEDALLLLKQLQRSPGRPPLACSS